MVTKNFLAGAALLVLSACTVGPDFHAPSMSFPDFWNVSGKEKGIGKPVVARPGEGDLAADWWTTFRDPMLNRMEADIASQNLDVQTAIARVDEARAQRGIAASDLYPQINGSASYTKQKPSDKGAFSLFGGGGSGASGSSGASGGGAGAPGSSSGANAIPTSTKIAPFGVYQYGFDLSWELDLWGGIRRGVESADASLLAQEEVQRNALLSAQAELADDYIQLRGLQAQLRIARANIDAAQAQSNLVNAQANSGLSSEEDTTSAAAQVALQYASLPQLQQQTVAQINAIEMLLGQNPGAMGAALDREKAMPPLPAHVPVSVPSDLIRRRPDIRAAEARLHAATADVGVATADFYPNVTLMGNGALQALRPKNLNEWAARTWSFGPSVTLPIFEGGRLTKTLELRKAQQREAAIAWRQTVLQAMHEVDNALTALLAEQRRQQHLARAGQAQQLALTLAQSRYKNGLATLVDVTVAEQNLFSVRQQTAQSRTTLGQNLIQLYKALGGGVEGQETSNYR